MDLLARGERPLFVGVVHLAPLPGAPCYAGSIEAVLARAAADAAALAEGGADALLVENFGDAPFFAGRVPAETVAAMALALAEVRRAAPGCPAGVNVLRNDALSALGLCASAGAAFLRVNVHTGAAVTDQGLIEGRAAETLRARARLAPAALILADVHVKHAQPLGGGDLAATAAETFERGLADALILTGPATGSAPDPAQLARVRERVPAAPLLVGSGLTPDNAAALLRCADGAIVGTALKRGGDVAAPVDPERVAAVRRAFDERG
jgi:membrane complex biogenesis BtpA family protein